MPGRGSAPRGLIRQPAFVLLFSLGLRDRGSELAGLTQDRDQILVDLAEIELSGVAADEQRGMSISRLVHISFSAGLTFKPRIGRRYAAGAEDGRSLSNEASEFLPIRIRLEGGCERRLQPIHRCPFGGSQSSRFGTRFGPLSQRCYLAARRSGRRAICPIAGTGAGRTGVADSEKGDALPILKDGE